MQAEDGAGRCHTQLLSESKWMQRNIGSKWFNCHELAILNGPFSIERRSEMAHLMVQIRQGDRREVFQAAVSSATTPHTLPLFTISEHVQMIKNLRDQFPSMQAKRRKEFIAKIALKRYQTTFQAMPVAVHVAVADDCLRKKVDWRFQVPNGNDMHGRNYCVQQELSGLTCHRCQRKSSNSAFQSPKPQVFHSLQEPSGTSGSPWICSMSSCLKHPMWGAAFAAIGKMGEPPDWWNSSRSSDHVKEWQEQASIVWMSNQGC